MVDRSAAKDSSFGAPDDLLKYAFVANVDPRQSHLCYTSAGRGPALMVSGRTHRHLPATGPALGGVEIAGYRDCHEPFEHDALLVVVTDGFSEYRNAGLDSMRFGTAGIVRALAFDTVGSSRSAAAIIARSADIFSGGYYHDDATVAFIARRAS